MKKLSKPGKPTTAAQVVGQFEDHSSGLDGG